MKTLPDRTEHNQKLEIVLGPKDPDTYAHLQGQLAALIEKTVATVTRGEISEEAKETLGGLSHLAAGYAKARVERPTIENEKLISEIEVNFAHAEEARARARKADAEAEGIELENALKRFEVALRALEIGKQAFSEGEQGVRLDVSQDKG